MNPDTIIIHCSATRDSGTVSWQAIRRYHTDTLGWSNIGYHYGIELVNETYETFLGRLPDERGAHCKAAGMNDHSIGVCMVGDFDGRAVPEKQMAKCINLIRYLMKAYSIKKDNVIGHREVEPKKTCPGLRVDMDEFRSKLSDQVCAITHV
jgi:N-acetylmuramoyl-L-alanine amidase